jgi:hypothetical protein
MGVKVIHVDKSYYTEDEGDYLPYIKRGKEQEEKQREAREPTLPR